ncbi:MAG: hypothetical protein LBI10_06685, partial [Deltaproteobacteria bacterium]|nr:hypothetical protein [Deltaproteobacteria bacterium]
LSYFSGSLDFQEFCHVTRHNPGLNISEKFAWPVCREGTGSGVLIHHRASSLLYYMYYYVLNIIKIHLFLRASTPACHTLELAGQSRRQIN